MENRKRGIFYSLLVILFLVFISIISSNGANRNRIIPDINKMKIKNIFFTFKEFKILNPYLTIKTIDDGYDIYVPTRNGYRYGPSIIYYDDGTMDAWFASNGNNIEWDWITYRHFDGNEWSEEEVVLRPTKKSLDHYSVCDPGVIYFNDYYYLGYTSTDNATGGGVENCIYVARSKKPNGPFEKWDGEGWGGKPYPIIEYVGDDLQWGAGEISFVVVDDQLFCYYTLINENGSFEKVGIADTSENWPATLKNAGIAFGRVNNQGSFDVTYNDRISRFLAFGIENNFDVKSCIAVYQSFDGYNFEQIDSVKGIEEFAHNMGISKKKDGHITYGDNLIVGYAYSKSNRNIWGRWATRLQSIELKLECK